MGIDLEVFDLLSKSQKPLNLYEITQETRTDITSKARSTLCRLMRYLSSVAMLKEVAVNTFAATNVSQALANPGQQAGVRFLLVSLHCIVLSHS